MTDLEALVAAALLGAAPVSPSGPTLGHALACPDDMELVVGTHVEEVQRLCTDLRNVKYCYSFFPGLEALERRHTPIATCMDTYEWPNQRGAEPEVMMRFVEAEASCEAVGKRLCTEFEWELACEGPDRLAWPYGMKQDPHACNNDQPYRPISESRIHSANPDVRAKEVARLWQGEPSGNRSSCVSSFGVVDLVGNIEEWVQTSRPEWPYRSSLKGGYWSKPWTGCRGTNDSHGPMFRFYQVGFRCCADPTPQ